MSYVEVLLMFLVSFVYIYILGFLYIGHRRNNNQQDSFYKKNIILYVIVSIIIVVLYSLIVELSFDLYGTLTIVIVSSIYLNIFIPITFSNEIDKLKQIEEHIHPLIMGISFLLLYVVLYFVYTAI